MRGEKPFQAGGCLAAVLLLFLVAGPASVGGQTKTGILRLVSYNIDCEDQSSDANITGSSHSLPTVIEGIALHHLGTNAQQIDTLNVEELNSTTLSNFTVALTNIYGYGTYAYDTTFDTNTGGGPDGLIYNTRTIQVVSGRCLRTGETVLLQSNGTYVSAHSPGGGSNGVTRGPLCYRLRPIGFGTNNDFYMYISHARSTSDDSQGDARYAEAQEIRSDAKYNLPAGSHILFAGDWNLFNGSGENAYKCLTGQVTSDGINWADTSGIWANTNQTQGYDPTSKTSPPTTTTWANVSSDHANYLYDDSTDSGTYATTSRLDIQLPNALMYGAYYPQGGVQLTPNTSDPYDVSNFPASQYSYSFEVFGNNGSVPYGDPVTQAGNNSLADLNNTVPNATTVINDIVEVTGANFSGSDHYPIFGDYTIVVPSAFQLWQLQYFGCTNCPNAQPAADADGTGQNNYFKYVAGLNPTNPASIFAFNIAGVTNTPSSVGVNFSPVETGRTYTLRYTTNLNANATWTAVAAASMKTNGSQVTIIDTNSLAAHKFYQLLIAFP